MCLHSCCRTPSEQSDSLAVTVKKCTSSLKKEAGDWPVTPENSCLGRYFTWYLQGRFLKGDVIPINWFKVSQELVEGAKSWGWIWEEG